MAGRKFRERRSMLYVWDVVEGSYLNSTPLNVASGFLSNSIQWDCTIPIMGVGTCRVPILKEFLPRSWARNSWMKQRSLCWLFCFMARDDIRSNLVVSNLPEEPKYYLVNRQMTVPWFWFSSCKEEIALNFYLCVEKDNKGHGKSATETHIHKDSDSVYTFAAEITPRIFVCLFVCSFLCES